MKKSAKVTSSRRKQRSRHLISSSSQRRKIMSCRLSKELREKYGVRSLPIRKNDEIKILKGKAKNKTGKVVQVYRKNFSIYADKIHREKQNGISVFLPLKPSNCVIEKIHLDEDRKSLINRRSKDRRKYKNKCIAMKNEKNLKKIQNDVNYIKIHSQRLNSHYHFLIELEDNILLLPSNEGLELW
jgi:large subunit ribosomal protein L26e